MSKEALFLLDHDGCSNKHRVKFLADCSLDELVQAAKEKFKNFLDKKQLCVTGLQLYDKRYEEYVDIEESELKDIPNCSKIKVLLFVNELCIFLGNRLPVICSRSHKNSNYSFNTSKRLFYKADHEAILVT